MAAYEDQLRAGWDTMLRHQLPQLPPFDGFWSELPAFFDWMEGKSTPPSPKPYRMSAGEQVLRAKLGGFPALGLRGTALETIRFAAANHLCVDLDYVNEQGRRSVWRIEPYSLRRSQAGDILLHAERIDGGHRTYRIDRIRGATVTTQGFAPRHAIELTT